MPNATWIDDNREYNEQDEATIQAIAKRITQIERNEEQRSFRRMADIENGYDYDPCEDCECAYCLHNNHRCDSDGTPRLAEDGTLENCCSICETVCDLTECETVADDRRREAKRIAGDRARTRLVTRKTRPHGCSYDAAIRTLERR